MTQPMIMSNLTIDQMMSTVVTEITSSGYLCLGLVCSSPLMAGEACPKKFCSAFVRSKTLSALSFRQFSKAFLQRVTYGGEFAVIKL